MSDYQMRKMCQVKRVSTKTVLAFVSYDTIANRVFFAGIRQLFSLDLSNEFD